MISLLVAAAYAGLSVGAVLDADVDGHSQRRDTDYRVYVGEDKGDWRVELSAERLGSGISFDNILSLAYGITARRDFDFGNYTLSAGAGADVLDVQAVQGVQPIAQGSGFSLHGDLSLERRVTSSTFVTATVTYRASRLDFMPLANTDFRNWRTASLMVGVRKEFGHEH